MQAQTFPTIDAYIAQFSPEIQKLLQKIRQTIHAAAPEAEEAMRYGIPTFRLHDKNLVHFGGYQEHIGFYPAPSGIAAFADEMKEYQEGKGTIRFPHSEPIPYDLITRVTQFRVSEVDKTKK